MRTMTPTTADILKWVAANMPNLSRTVSGMSHQEAHAHLSNVVNYDADGDRRVLLRKLKQMHYGD